MPDPYVDPDGDTQDSTAIQQLRDAYAKLEKDLKERDKALAKANQQLAEQQVKQRLESVKAFGLTESQAKAFLKMNEEAEVNADTVKSFAADLGIPLGGSEPPQEDITPDVPAFVPVPGDEPATKKMAWDEYKKILATDQRRAVALAQQGLVEGIDPD